MAQVHAASEQQLAQQVAQVEHLSASVERAAKKEPTTPTTNAILDEAMAACSARTPAHAERYDSARHEIVMRLLTVMPIPFDQPWPAADARFCAFLVLFVAWELASDATLYPDDHDSSLRVPIRVLAGEMYRVLRRHELVDTSTRAMVEMRMTSATGAARGSMAVMPTEPRETVHVELPPDDIA